MPSRPDSLVRRPAWSAGVVVTAEVALLVVVVGFGGKAGIAHHVERRRGRGRQADLFDAAGRDLQAVGGVGVGGGGAARLRLLEAGGKAAGRKLAVDVADDVGEVQRARHLRQVDRDIGGGAAFLDRDGEAVGRRKARQRHC